MKAPMQEKVKAILIDDEKAVRDLMKDALKSFNFIDVVAEAANVPEAVKMIHREKPQLLFLDIEMPGYSGLQLLDFFNDDELNFDIIFVTAYNEYAIKAFKVAAFDYLLKPVDENQLEETLLRYQDKKLKKQIIQQVDLLRTAYKQEVKITKIAIASTYGIDFIEIDDINFLEADNNYTKIYLTNDSRIVASKPLSEFEEILAPFSVFFRSHRSYLLNINCIARFNTKDGAFIEMKNGDKIPLSRYRRKAFESIFTKIKI